jgi:hypothetical protein
MLASASTVCCSERSQEGEDMTIQLGALLISTLNLVIFLISVVFVYRQLRQVDKSIRGSTYQTLIYDGSRISGILVEHPELADVFEGVEYVGSVGDLKTVQQAWIITMALDHYENIYFQHEQGLMPDVMWDRWERHLTTVFTTTPRIQEQWEKAKGVYYRPFREFIDRAIAQAAPPRPVRTGAPTRARPTSTEP